MPGSMPLRNISKGPTLRSADRVLEDPLVRLKVLRRLVENDEQLSPQPGILVFGEVVIKHLIMKQAELDRIVRWWLADAPPGYWPSYEYKSEIINTGYRKALELSLGLSFMVDAGGDVKAGRAVTSEDLIGLEEAILNSPVDPDTGFHDHGKPIVTYWFCAGHYFQTIVGESNRQITLHLLTPSYPQNVIPEKTLNYGEGVWLVSNEADRKALEKAEQWGGPHPSVPAEPGRPEGVFVTQIFGESDGAFDQRPQVR